MKTAAQMLAENILSLFNETSRSANEVGKSSGVGQTTISSWLRKARESDPTFNPRLDQLEALSKAFGLSVPSLFMENLGRNKSLSGGQEAVPEQRMSKEAQRVTELIAAVDQMDGAKDVLSAVETLLRKTLPAKSNLAYGPAALQSVFAKYAQDAESLTPDAIKTLNRQIDRATPQPTTKEEKDEQREQKKGIGS